MVNIGEMMNKAIMDGMLQAIIIFMPYIIPFLTINGSASGTMLNWNPSFQFASLSSDLANRLHK